MDRLLIVERQASRRLILRRLAESAGFDVDVTHRVAEAPAPVSSYRAVIVDTATWETELRDAPPFSAVVLSSDEGASGFEGPRLSRSADVAALREALGEATTVGRSSPVVENSLDSGGFLTREPAGLALLEEVERLADSPVSVLVEGESGTGKELIAHALHERSSRRGAPFVAVNCSAIPSELLESEIFGHERGAFTDAIRRHVGCFERANQGTLFLDEIGDMPLALQPKLLRVLEARVLTRVGGEKEIGVGARVVAATHRDLRREAAEGRFRADLYHRLAVARLHIPPLRERPADLRWLTELWLVRFAREYGQPPRALSEASWRRMLTHRWPGNVRELQNFLRRALLLQPEGELDLIPEAAPDTGGPTWIEELRQSLRRELAAGEDFERVAERIRRAVEESLASNRPGADSGEKHEQKE
jgi:DNA-binding NtrC family response regulator